MHQQMKKNRYKSLVTAQNSLLLSGPIHYIKFYHQTLSQLYITQIQ